MATNISTYALKLVKVKGGRYEGNGIITDPATGANLIEELFDMETQAEEIMVMLTLNTKHKVTGAFEVSRGTLNSSLVHPREVFKRALLNNAAAIIIGHNHPSGNPTPSQDDIAITKRLVEAGNLLGVKVLDHIITGESGQYTSLREQGII